MAAVSQVLCIFLRMLQILTTVLLNLSQETCKCIWIFYHFTNLSYHEVKSVIKNDTDLFCMHSQLYGCWWFGDTRSQGISSYVIIPPASTKLMGGILVSPCPSVRPSVCPSVRLSVCPFVDRIVSALYLQQYSSDPFHICTSYQATSEGVSRVMPVSKFKYLKFWRIFKICNFDFVIFWLGIQYDSMVWVIMRRRGVSSERRRSSCSSWPGFPGIFQFHDVLYWYQG